MNSKKEHPETGDNAARKGLKVTKEQPLHMGNKEMKEHRTTDNRTACPSA